MKPEIFEGKAVISQKGRDKGRYFVVLLSLDADFVMVSDGDTRRLSRMKKKRRKHLRALPVSCDEILHLYKQGCLKDSDIRKVLLPLRKAAEEAGQANREGLLDCPRLT